MKIVILFLATFQRFIKSESGKRSMSADSLLRRALSIYRKKGFRDLLERGQLYLWDRWEMMWDKVRRILPTTTKCITLNGVEVPVETHPLDRFIPFYQPPHPTRDDETYEYTEVDAIRTFFEDDGRAVIIGGGLGVTTVIAAKMTNKQVTVYEQSEDTCEILKRTVQHNDLIDQVKIICKGVGDVFGSNLTHGPPSNPELVPASDLPEAELYEMDCEGAEISILNAMTVRPSILLVETHNNHEDVVDLITDLGYEISDVKREAKGQHPDCTHVRAIYSPT